MLDHGDLAAAEQGQTKPLLHFRLGIGWLLLTRIGQNF
jgi:hypothetical protein